MSTPQDIVVFGAGGYARVAADAAEASGGWRVLAFVDRDPAPGASLLGRPVWPESSVLAGGQFSGACLVAIGDNFQRQRLSERIGTERPDLTYATAIHPRATVSRHAQIGAGSVLLAGVVVNALASLGKHVTIYSNAVVEHDCILEDFVTLAPGAALGGAVRIGARTFVGLGTTICHGRTIGADCVTGAHATILRDLPACVTAVGTPARIVRNREPGDSYL